MVHPSDLFNVNFYKKEVFYGSDRGMHYRLSREEVSAAPAASPAAAEDGSAAPEADSGASSNAQAPEEAPATRTVFRLITWPGPYNFAHTPEEKKKTKEFPFSNDALTEIADYLNAEHAAYYED
ncbi:MAG: hypothetical protein ACOX8G_00370 [Eubacterium sp.]|jgi:hypothetical protein